MAIIAIIIALVVVYYSLLGGGILGSNQGPIATGPGNSQIENPQPVYSSGSSRYETGDTLGSGEGAKLKPGESPYKGQIRIENVERSSDRPEEEYITIGYSSYSSSNKYKPVDVSGWKIATLRESETIPRAYTIPEIDAVESDIFLPPGGDLVVVSGSPSYTRNFRENKCVGYFNERHSFTPALSNSCPDNNIDRGLLLGKGFNGQCIDAIDGISSCHTPVGPFASDIVKSECIDYMSQNFNYVGCVKNFRDDKDFLETTWRVALRRNRKFYNSRHDQVTLRDANGLLVDQFEY